MQTGVLYREVSFIQRVRCKRFHCNYYFSTSLCTSLDWDRDGDVLAVTQDKNGQLLNYRDYIYVASNFMYHVSFFMKGCCICGVHTVLK